MNYLEHLTTITHDLEIKNDNLNQEIQYLLQRLQNEPHMSMVRSFHGDAEIVVMKEFHSDNKEYLRITVNRNREELLMRLPDFNLLFDSAIPSSLPEGECEECNKKNE
ncbi:hypothetical protein GCM10023310_72190 [Paenibacillus vulneris]|uniref:Uncharacterized protein n=1 Tax=Paenibacillus vulneris TaxID=1133364 RepID=A0ABW3UGA2_9BACL